MLSRQDSDHPLDQIRFGLMVAIGGEDPRKTLAIIAEQEETVARELREVPQRAEALGEEFVSASVGPREGLLKKLEDYASWLRRARESLQSNDTSTTMLLHEQSQELLPELTVALDAYAKAYASFGPFRSALCNTLWRLVGGINEQQLEKQTWSQYCEYYQNELAAKLQTLAELDLPGRTPLLTGYGESLAAVQGLLKKVPTSQEAVQSTLEALDEQYAPTEVLEGVIAKASEQGPTAIPATNVLLKVVGEARAELGDALVLAVLDDYNETVEGYLETFERAVARPTHSDLIREEIPRTLDTIDGHFMLIEDLNDSLENSELEELDSLLKKIAESANKLIESREVYEVAALHHSHKACPSCSRSNPPENTHCEACGETLPQVDKTARRPSSTFSLMSGPISEETRQAEMTENVARLFQACDDVHDGKITTDQFTQELHRAATALAEFVEEYENQVNIALDESLFSPEEWETWRTQHLPYLEDLAISYYAGIEDLRMGLVSMETFLTEPDRAHLVEGIRLYWQGIQAIHRGKLGMVSHAKLLNDFIKDSERE
jgi:hypothetical protein